MRQGWRLSAAQWAVLTHALFPADLGLLAYPPPIQALSYGRTDVEWSRVRAEVNAQLAHLGLLRTGRMDPDLEAALHLLHRPECWVDSVWQPDPPAAGQPVRMVAAAHGTAGVCALQYPDQPGATLLEIIPARGLAATVVRKLPPHPPGRSPGVTVPLGPGTAPERPEVLVPVPTALTSAERSAATATAVLNRPHARAGQSAANMRGSSGRVRRSEVLRWCDNPDGRYQVTISRPAGGSAALSVCPADPQRLGDAVQRLLSSVRPGDQ